MRRRIHLNPWPFLAVLFAGLYAVSCSSADRKLAELQAKQKELATKAYVFEAYSEYFSDRLCDVEDRLNKPGMLPAPEGGVTYELDK